MATTFSAALLRRINRRRLYRGKILSGEGRTEWRSEQSSGRLFKPGMEFLSVKWKRWMESKASSLSVGKAGRRASVCHRGNVYCSPRRHNCRLLACLTHSLLLLQIVFLLLLLQFLLLQQKGRKAITHVCDVSLRLDHQLFKSLSDILQLTACCVGYDMIIASLSPL